MKGRVDISYAGVGDVIRLPGITANLAARAERVAARARELAPAEPRYDDYRENLATSTRANRRRSAVVTAGVDYAMQVEASHRILGLAIDAAHD